ncbi:hypothetical protein C0J52_03755 [Blattella germanica]|nr:hypothetical protein C0J52_03755 [Blattella germanica]
MNGYLLIQNMAPLKLYSVSDSPPTLAVRLALKALNIEHSLVNIDFAAGEHLTDDYAKKNPQREVPCIDDNGFLLSESIAILQYLADKYGTNDSLYPKDAQLRALVNHRLAFTLSTYYRYISEYVMAPIFYAFAYERTPLGLKKVNTGLSIFNTLLERQGTKYAASDKLTIADFALVSATMCLEAIGFGLEAHPLVAKWYSDFKKDFPELWAVVAPGMKEIHDFNKNPPDLSALNHPLHPKKK